MIRVGFTGTQKGMTLAQHVSVKKLLAEYVVQLGRGEDIEFHHGDCIGADVEAAHLAWYLGYRVVCHPPLNEKERGFYRMANETRPADTYPKRNQRIVKECDLLIAVPSGPMVRRSGTWSAIRCARRRRDASLHGIPRIEIVWPSGRVELDVKS